MTVHNTLYPKFVYILLQQISDIADTLGEIKKFF
jgi:hypothetical protein